MKKGRTAVDDREDNVRIQEFLDMIAPSVIKFETDHFICGNTYRCVWALREYPTATEEQAILSHLGEKDGVTLRIYTRHVTPVEERKIISNAANKNRMDRSNTSDLQQTVLAESNLQDVTTIVLRTKGRFFYTRTRSGSRADRGTRFGLCGGGTQARAFS